MDFALGDHVECRPYHPGDVWDSTPYWVCGKITDEASWRPPVTWYRLAALTDPQAYQPLHTGIHATMLRPLGEN